MYFQIMYSKHVIEIIVTHAFVTLHHKSLKIYLHLEDAFPISNSIDLCINIVYCTHSAILSFIYSLSGSPKFILTFDVQSYFIS